MIRVQTESQELQPPPHLSCELYIHRSGGDLISFTPSVVKIFSYLLHLPVSLSFERL